MSLQEMPPCQCDRLPSGGELLALIDAQREKSCEPFCMDSICPCLKPWAERCLIHSCAGGTQKGHHF